MDGKRGTEGHQENIGVDFKPVTEDEISNLDQYERDRIAKSRNKLEPKHKIVIRRMESGLDPVEEKELRKKLRYQQNKKK